MSFIKGDSRINYRGRPKGSKDKATSEIRDAFQLIVENNIEQLSKDLKAMTGSDRVKTILDIAKFVLPTLKATEIKQMNSEFEPIEIIIHDK
jgi:hypothetical protein